MVGQLHVPCWASLPRSTLPGCLDVHLACVLPAVLWASRCP